MTTTLTNTFNRDDVRRVFASFAADYRIIAEWTKIHSASYIKETASQILWLAEEQYIKEVHLQLKSASGAIRQAAVYRVSTNASSWSSDRPGSLYWPSYDGDDLNIVVFYSDNWFALTDTQRAALKKVHLPNWTTSDFSGSYGTMSGSTDKHFSSRAYGLDRTTYA